MPDIPAITAPHSLSQAVAVYEAMLTRARQMRDRAAERRLSAALVRLKTIRSRRDACAAQGG